jgi:hypothetical protein
MIFVEISWLYVRDNDGRSATVLEVPFCSNEGTETTKKKMLNSHFVRFSVVFSVIPR